eukprot:1140643-Pelagomonas_calceolata.AAC.3
MMIQLTSKQGDVVADPGDGPAIGAVPTAALDVLEALVAVQVWWQHSQALTSSMQGVLNGHKHGACGEHHGGVPARRPRAVQGVLDGHKHGAHGDHHGGVPANYSQTKAREECYSGFTLALLKASVQTTCSPSIFFLFCEQRGH